ncbi:MAG: hypothetical protein ACKPKO_38875, partial [Candidatus Fonsibacter sp.]
MTDPLVEALLLEPLLDGQWSCRVKAEVQVAASMDPHLSICFGATRFFSMVNTMAFMLLSYP